MPYIEHSTYQPKSFLNQHPHLSTIIPGVIKKYPTPNYIREKHELADGDFLLLDWLNDTPSDKLIIITHGLEGNSRRTYISSAADYFYQNGYHVLAWNQRSCGGEMNRNFRLYHHGVTEDLEQLIELAHQLGYQEIYLLGYSLGGAQTLNYLGRRQVHPKVRSAITISAPLSIKSSVLSLKKFPNTFYMRNFIRDLVPKLRVKAQQFPNKLPVEKLKGVSSFDIIDDYFTAPMHGFKDKEDYYQSVSPLPYLQNITIPTLVVNAWNDPFIDTECYPVNQLKNSTFVYFETPKYGGHCGFPIEGTPYSWVELRALEFINQL